MDAKEKEQVTEARKKFIANLKNHVRELGEFKARGEPVEDEILRIVLDGDMVEWAQQARVSKYYRRF